MNLTSLNDVLADQVGDLQSAEAQLIEALPKMASAASTPELQQAFTDHLEETRGHARRLAEVARLIDLPIPVETCQAMEGLIREGSEIVQADGDPLAKDAALIAAAQRVEHYEIAAYGTARQLAGDCGYDAIKDLMDKTLEEESAADKTLTKIATGGMFRAGVNQHAMT